MKILTSLIALSLVSSTAAFVPTTTRSNGLSSSSLMASEADIAEKLPMSKAIPFLERPKFLDGTLAGDVGFDPLNFARGEKELLMYREAEIKHSRLAMLAAVGWPLSELFDKKIASFLHLSPVLDATDRAPSLLNGGLGKISPLYWIVCLAFAGWVDFNGTNRATFEAEGYFPGNLGFDPLGLWPKNEDEQKHMLTAEIKHGRVAMMAVLGYAAQEFIYGTGIVNETPFFFTPLL